MLVRSVNAEFHTNQNFNNINQQNSVINKFNLQPIKDKLSFTGGNHSIKRELKLMSRNLMKGFFKELKFVKDGSAYIIEHKRNGTFLSSPVINNIAYYVNRAKEELNVIIQSAQPEEFEKFIRKLLKYKEKNPFKMFYNGCTYILKHDNFLLVGARKINDPGYAELNKNPQMYNFLANMVEHQGSKNVKFRGKTYKIEPIFDGPPVRNLLVGLNAEAVA